MGVIDRQQVLAYRAAAHDLGGRGDGAVVLGVGLQDYPPGRSASLALALRTGPQPPAGLALVHSARGALHLHLAADLPVLRAALRVPDAAWWATHNLGPQGVANAAAGVDPGVAVDRVAALMVEAMADGVARTKGELSGAVSPHLDEGTAPWCAGCGVHHVSDMLFRIATLQAGLTVELDPTTPSQFRYVAGPADRADVDESRAELVRRFLAAFGPARPEHLATWLGLRPAAARAWFALVAGDLATVEVGGRPHRFPAASLAALTDPPPATGVRLLAAYDPLLELADRKLFVPEPERRRTVWQFAANPGVLWVDGELAGTWRAKRTGGDRLTITVAPFDGPTAVPERDVETIRRAAGATTVTIRTSEP